MNRENPPAFPRPASQHEYSRLYACPSQDGMTLRDYFAAKAISLFSLTQREIQAFTSGINPRHDFVAKFCYDLADAMLEMRNKPKEDKNEKEQKNKKEASNA